MENLISEQEITDVLQSWPNNKSPGPEKFTGEFYKNFQDLLVPQILNVLSNTMITGQSLFPLNSSYITLIPKKEGANKPQDFRSIILVHGVQNFFSKILANRL
jgi:hypothetical protein